MCFDVALLNIHIFWLKGTSGIIVIAGSLYKNGAVTNAMDLLPTDIQSDYLIFTIKDINNAGRLVGEGLRLDFSTWQYITRLSC